MSHPLIDSRLVIIAVCALAVATTDLPAQSTSRVRQADANRINLKSTLTEKMVASLASGRSLTVKVPSGEQSIGSLTVKRVESYRDEPATVRPKVTVKDSVVFVDIPPSLFQQLDYQPLRIRIFESGITRIELRPVEEYQGKPAFESEKADLVPNFYVRLKPAKGLPVRMNQSTGFRITNDVFDHEVPYSIIKGIYFDKLNQRKVTVVLKNGDNLSGEHHWPVIVKLETKWGDEKVSLDEIVSVTRSSTNHVVDSGVKSPKLIVEEK